MISGKLVRVKAVILGAATAALALSAIALPAKAQPYPTRSITILVGYSAGGQADALARIIGKQLGETLKISVGGAPDDFRRQIEVDYQARGKLVRALGITGE